MPLSKRYTLLDVENILRVLTQQLTPDKIQSNTFKNIINKNLLDFSSLLNGIDAPDYGMRSILSLETVNYLSPVVGTIGYARRAGLNDVIVFPEGHGFLDDTYLGRRIVFSIENEGSVLYIQTIINKITSIYEIEPATTLEFIPVDETRTILAMQVYPQHEDTAYTVDVSSMNIDKIISVTDSRLGLINSKGDLQFEELNNNTDYSKSAFYNYFGGVIRLWKGSEVSGFNDVSLAYYRLPVFAVNKTDYIDLKDCYVPILIDKCKLEIYEMLKLVPPKELSQSVEGKIAQLTQSQMNKSEAIRSAK